MTRFIVCLPHEDALDYLSRLLDNLGYTWKINTSGLVSYCKYLQTKINNLYFIGYRLQLLLLINV